MITWGILYSKTAPLHMSQGDSVEYKRRAAILGRLQSSSVLQTVHFRVAYDTIFLNSLIVAATDDLAIDHQDGANRNAAFAQALSRFFNRGLEERVHIDVRSYLAMVGIVLNPVGLPHRPSTLIEPLIGASNSMVPRFPAVTGYNPAKSNDACPSAASEIVVESKIAPVSSLTVTTMAPGCALVLASAIPVCKADGVIKRHNIGTSVPSLDRHLRVLERGPNDLAKDCKAANVCAGEQLRPPGDSLKVVGARGLNHQQSARIQCAVKCGSQQRAFTEGLGETQGQRQGIAAAVEEVQACRGGLAAGIE